MVRADLRVLIDFKYISFLATNSKMPSFFEAQIPWKLQAGDFLLVFSPVQLFGTQWDTTIFAAFSRIRTMYIKQPFLLYDKVQLA